jgi:chemosensory pili system protein ChpA (sensor histidine kinase/response regulator)
MLPFATLESRLQRCVRQASRQAEKDIHFSIVGGDTLVDSVVLQQLAAPLMHLLRNSVDHGIESSESRLAAGKPSQGNIQLQIKELGGSLTIQCQDDGRGIDRQAVVEQAIRQGLLADDVDAQTLSDEVIEHYILQSGFSTRDTASQLSGRGIGLDAVVSQLQMCRGSLSLHSTPGQGCCFTASLPQCMQSGYGLLISTAGRSLALLTRGIKQIIYLEPSDVDQIDFQGGYFDGDNLITVETLDIHLQLDQYQADATRARVLLLVERVGEPLYGLLVDAISACRELVIKPLNQFTPHLPGIVGATVLGDGSVAPVIDSAELLNRAVSPAETETTRAPASAEVVANHGGRPMALVVDDSLSVRRSLSEFVTDLGMDVRTAKDGFEAIHVIEEQVPTLMLVDLEMPRMNGLELTAHVRAHQQARQVPVIMITSRNTEKHRRMANEVGVNQFLSKPYSEDELAQTIQTQMAS